MNYAIKHTNGAVKALVELPNGQSLPTGFETITKEIYTEGNEILKAGSRYLTYDDVAKRIVADNVLNDSAEEEIKRIAQREKLKGLYSERQLKVALNEDTTAIDTEITNTQNDYNSTNP